MFKNTLRGLTKKEKEIFDAVCMHLNGCMSRMGIRHLDGEEDQLLIDLWMDMYPYKRDEDGEVVTRTVSKQVWKTVDGVYQQVTEEKVIKELDFENSLAESTSVGIYKWRAEQLFLNKVTYLYGDKRVRKRNEDGEAYTQTITDRFGNERVRAVFEDEIDTKKVSKRDFSRNINESDLARDGEDPMTIEDVAGGVEGGYSYCDLMMSLGSVCDEVELKVVNRIIEGTPMTHIYKELAEEGINWTSRMMTKLKEKLGPVLKPTVTA